MKVTFRTSKLQRVCNEEKAGVRELGSVCGSKLRQRLAELAAADTLEDLSHLPPMRCHELVNRNGVFSVDLQHPFRLLFRAADDPPPRRADGGIDRAAVTAILITDIEDTHDAKNQRRGRT